MTYKQIIEINEQIKKAIQRIENIGKKYDELREKYKAKEQECNEYFELMAIRTEVLAKIANKLGINTAIIENKEIFNKIDQFKRVEQKLEKIKLDNQRETYWKEYKKLKQALTEIKDVLNFYADSKIGEKQGNGTYKILLNGSCILNYDPKPAIEALKKISEAINED